jgi:hypothetical protein
MVGPAYRGRTHQGRMAGVVEQEASPFGVVIRYACWRRTSVPSAAGLPQVGWPAESIGARRLERREGATGPTDARKSRQGGERCLINSMTARALDIGACQRRFRRLVFRNALLAVRL